MENRSIFLKNKRDALVQSWEDRIPERFIKALVVEHAWCPLRIIRRDNVHIGWQFYLEDEHGQLRRYIVDTASYLVIDTEYNTTEKLPNALADLCRNALDEEYGKFNAKKGE